MMHGVQLFCAVFLLLFSDGLGVAKKSVEDDFDEFEFEFELPENREGEEEETEEDQETSIL